VAIVPLGHLIDQFGDLGRVVQAAAQRASRRIEQHATAGMKSHFDTATAPDGTPWPRLRFPRPAGGDKPLRDRGLLMASAHSKLEWPYLYLRANSPGARLHNWGGVVQAQPGKALAIPITREASRLPGPRAFPRPLFMIWRQGAQGGVLAERVGRGRNQQIKVHYVLKRRVEIPKREFLGVSEKTATRIADEVWGEAVRMVAGSGG